MSSERRRLPVILIWSSLGFVFVLLQLYVYGSWVFSTGFKPVSTGSDPVPNYSLVSMRAFEILSTVTLVLAIIWFVRGIVRDRRIDSIRLMMIGWTSAYWLDPFLNFLHPMFTYNAYLFNMGSWANFIPGYIAPNGDRIAEPLLVDPANYFVTFTVTALAGVWAMKKAKSVWPTLNKFVQTLCAIPAIWVSMGIMDVLATRLMHFDGWLITTWSLSLWGGNFYQFPVYEFLVFPLAFLTCSLLLYHTDEYGFTAIESGHERL